MKIGFIGAGTVARTFGRHLITAGHTMLVSNSRGPETLADFVPELGPNAIAGTKHQAVRSSFSLQIGSRTNNFTEDAPASRTQLLTRSHNVQLLRAVESRGPL
jgi:pyrroline-5-carboxylate reductase